MTFGLSTLKPAPCTPTRRPEVVVSAPWEARNSLTFSAPLSVKVITIQLLLGLRREVQCFRKCSESTDLATLTHSADDRRAQAAHRGVDSRRHGRGRRPQRRRG